jgi:acyl-CoA thioesterase-1
MLLRLLLIKFLIIFQPAFAESLFIAPDNQNTILVVGDSLSAAYGIDVNDGWVNLLRKQLEEYDSRYQWQVINASISGDTTTGGLERLPKLVDTYQPVLCIIALGANDGLRGQSLDLMHQNLQSMITLCNGEGKTLLVGIKLPPNYGDKYTQAFHEVYTGLANSNNIALVAFMLEGIALEDKYFQTDRLHPTAEAQPLILETIWSQLRPIIDEAKSS